MNLNRRFVQVRPSERLTHTDLNDPRRTYTVLEHLARYRFASQYVRGKSVIDAACGIGYGSKLLLDSGAASVTGFDISDEAIKTARDLYAGRKVSFEKRDITNGIPAHCDVFVSFETIEHLPLNRVERFISSIAAVLDENGILIISTPNRDAWNPGLTIHDHPYNPSHHFELSRDEFEQYLRQGFRDVKILNQIKKGLGYYVHRIVNAVAKRVTRSGSVSSIADRLGFYKIAPEDPNRTYFYFLAVCKGPIKNPNSQVGAIED